MNILFIVPSYKPAFIYGGPIVVIAQLAETLVKMGHKVTVYTTSANGTSELPVDMGVPIDVEGVNVYYFKRITKDHTHISTALWKHLNKTVKQFDVVHIHSWWNLLVIGAAEICRRNKIKPLISPHGMFSNYILHTNNSFKKRILHGLIGKRLLTASFLHVSTQMELDECRKIIPTWEGKIIPNLVTLSDREYPRKKNEVYTIGFLSRVDPKKGLDVLIQALSKVAFPYKLKVAGSGTDEYIQHLKELARNCGNANKIEWLGWKSGEEKFDYLVGLDLFALTSHSENFAIVVIESLSVGTPVLVSDQVGLHAYVNQKDWGWVTPMDLDVISQTITAAMLDSEKNEHINQQVSTQIKKEYEDTNLAHSYFEYYQNIRQQHTD